MTDMRYANIFYKWKDFHMNEIAAARWMKACKRKRVGGPCKCKWIQIVGHLKPLTLLS